MQVHQTKTSEGGGKKSLSEFSFCEKSTRGHSKCIQLDFFFLNAFHYLYWKVYLEEFLILYSKYC